MGDSEDKGLPVFVARLCVGLTQGVALYFLYTAMEDRTWPASDALVFGPLAFVAAYVPLVLILGLGNLRIVTLFVWTLIAGAIVAGLAWYDLWHAPGTAFQILRPGQFGQAPRIVPYASTWFFTSVFMFIAQSLIAGGDADRRIVARYATHFDVAWKLGLQIVLASLFVGVFWAIIFLGAELFHLIGIDYFQKLIEHRWFSIPVTTLAQAAALHLTDVRAGLVRGTRTLVLVLFSWLLPLMAVIGAGFLLSLFSTGLEPLWKTRFAAGYLLTSAGLLVFLINCAFQDGDAERRPPAILRYSGMLASLLLVPLVALSAYAIYLRIAQYGWTTQRVGSVACLAVAASYAAGYVWAVVGSREWLSRVPLWNFGTALLILAVIGAVYSPIADPMRISVDSQVARLMSGKTDVSKFDFRWLHWNGGRFGADALKNLASLTGTGRTAAIRARAVAELKERSEYNYPYFVPPTPPAPDGSNIAVFPKGRSLPPSFLHQTWTFGTESVPCLTYAGTRCNAYFLDLAGDGHTQIALIGINPAGGPYFANGLYTQDTDGVWVKVGNPDPVWACPSVAAALQAGRIQFAPPAHVWRTVAADGQTLPIQPFFQRGKGLKGMQCPG